MHLSTFAYYLAMSSMQHEGRKSGQKCGEVDENMSEHGIPSGRLSHALYSLYMLEFSKDDLDKK